MQELAQMIYDTTPGIEKDMPRHMSKILGHVVKEDKKPQQRASLFTSDGIRKGGSLANRDLTIAMSAEDWEHQYFEVFHKFEEAKLKKEELEDKLVSKQERYI
jgi:hypothetical protein